MKHEDKENKVNINALYEDIINYYLIKIILTKNNSCIFLCNKIFKLNDTKINIYIQR